MLRANTISGFTFVEILIVVAIVSIMAAIGYPSYQESVRKSGRKMGNATLIEVAGRQEQYFVNNKRYTGDLSLLGYPASSFYVDKEGQTYDALAGGTVYLVEVSASTDTTFTLQAVPQAGQTSDTCGTLTYTNTGARTPDTAGCW